MADMREQRTCVDTRMWGVCAYCRASISVVTRKGLVQTASGVGARVCGARVGIVAGNDCVLATRGARACVAKSRIGVIIRKCEEGEGGDEREGGWGMGWVNTLCMPCYRCS